MAKIVFKELTSNQNGLFPVSLSEKIAPNHPVRVVNSVVDALDIGCLLRAYKGGGTSSYHPRMMLKVLFYAYLNNIYSCRKIDVYKRQDRIPAERSLPAGQEHHGRLHAACRTDQEDVYKRQEETSEGGKTVCCNFPPII